MLRCTHLLTKTSCHYCVSPPDGPNTLPEGNVQQLNMTCDIVHYARPWMLHVPPADCGRDCATVRDWNIEIVICLQSNGFWLEYKLKKNINLPEMKKTIPKISDDPRTDTIRGPP